MRKEIIKALTTLDLTTEEKIAWGKRCKVSDWLVQGCASVVSGATRLDIDALAQCIGWEETARVLHALPMPQRRAVVTIDKSLFRCDSCGGRMNDPAGRLARYCGGQACTACGYPQLTSPYPVRVDIADICPKPSDKNSVEIVRKILADELKDME